MYTEDFEDVSYRRTLPTVRYYLNYLIAHLIRISTTRTKPEKSMKDPLEIHDSMPKMKDTVDTVHLNMHSTQCPRSSRSSLFTSVRLSIPGRLTTFRPYTRTRKSLFWWYFIDLNHNRCFENNFNHLRFLIDPDFCKKSSRFRILSNFSKYPRFLYIW